MAPHPPKSRTTIPSHSPPISSPKVYKSANRRTLEKRSTSSSKNGPSVCVSSNNSAGGCSLSSLARAADVPDDMLLDSNTHSFPRPGRDDEGRCDIGDGLSHLDAPNIVGDDVSIENSQTRRGPNATKPRPVHPSQREEIWVIDTEFVDNPGVVRSISSMLIILQEKETGGPVSFQVLFEDTHAQDGVYINQKAQKLGVIRLEEKMELQKQEHVTREKALRKEFEDSEAAINRQREEDRREWQDNLREFQKIMLGRSSHSPST